MPCVCSPAMCRGSDLSEPDQNMKTRFRCQPCGEVPGFPESFKEQMWFQGDGWELK